MWPFSLENKAQTSLQDIAMPKGKDDSARPRTVGMNFEQTDSDQDLLDEYLAKDKNRGLTTSDYVKSLVWTAVERAKSGDARAREWIARYVLGSESTVLLNLVACGQADRRAA